MTLFFIIINKCQFIAYHIAQLCNNTFFSCHNNSFLINDAPLFKLAAFNGTPFDIALFNLALFYAALFDAELFSNCTY